MGGRQGRGSSLGMLSVRVCGAMEARKQVGGVYAMNESKIQKKTKQNNLNIKIPK